MGAKQCNKFSLLPEEDILPLFEYLLCGRGQLCEKLHGMMHTYIQDHRRVSKSFLLPWMLDCQDRPSHFHLIKILILHNLKKNLLQTCSLSKRGFQAGPFLIQATTLPLGNRVRGKKVKKVRKKVSQSKYTMYMYECMCVSISVCVC